MNRPMERGENEPIIQPEQGITAERLGFVAQ